MVNVNEREQSEFNMAISYLNRLNNLFYEADRASIELDSFGWFNVLIALYRELSTEMKDNELAEYDQEILNINKLVKKNIGSITRHGGISIPPDLYMKLHKFELFLRKICKDSGLQTKMKDDPRFALN